MGLRKVAKVRLRCVQVHVACRLAGGRWPAAAPSRCGQPVVKPRTSACSSTTTSLLGVSVSLGQLLWQPLLGAKVASVPRVRHSFCSGNSRRQNFRRSGCGCHSPSPTLVLWQPTLSCLYYGVVANGINFEVNGSGFESRLYHLLAL